MVIHIDQIREAGYQVDQSLPAEQLDGVLQAEGHDTGFRAAGPGRLKATLRKLSGGVLVVIEALPPTLMPRAMNTGSASPAELTARSKKADRRPQ